MLVIPKKIVTTWPRLNPARALLDSAFTGAGWGRGGGWVLHAGLWATFSAPLTFPVQRQKFTCSQGVLSQKKKNKWVDYLRPWCFSSGSQHQAFSMRALMQMGKWLTASQSCFFFSFLFLVFLPFLFSPSGDLGSLGRGTMSISTRSEKLDLSRRTDLHLSVGKLYSFCWTPVIWTLDFRCWPLRPSEEINKGRCSGNFVWSLISFISEGKSAELFCWGIVLVVDLRREKYILCIDVVVWLQGCYLFPCKY